MNDGGQALVEFALVLPLLLTFALGVAFVADVGVARLTLEQAAAEGARAGALTNDDGNIRATVVAAAMPLDGTRLGIDIDPAAGSAARAGDPRGSLLRVTLSYRLAGPLAMLPPLIVRGSAARRVEWTP